MTAQTVIGAGPHASRPLARPTVLIAGGVLLLLFLLALLAPAIVPNDPYLGRLQDRLLPPSLEFPLGTDAMGRCLFSRLLMALGVTPRRRASWSSSRSPSAPRSASPAAMSAGRSTGC